MSKADKKKRIKQGLKLRQRQQSPGSRNDEFAMMAAGVDAVCWNDLPQHQKQLYRLRAQQALSVFSQE